MKLRETRTLIGFAVTFIYVVTGAVLLALHWNAADLGTAEKWGTFLGGVFSPLAFLWLIIGYYQQQEELRQNTQALRDQEVQLQRQVQETRALAEAAATQADIATRRLERDESKDRAATRPRFVGVDVGYEPTTLVFRIQNVGAAANAFNVRTRLGVIEGVTRQLYENGRAETFSLRGIPLDDSTEDLREFEVECLFQDGSGNRYVQRLFVSRTAVRDEEPISADFI